MEEEALELAADEMMSAIDRLKKAMASVRTGRANPAIVESVQVESYGSMLPLKQVATISVADARLLVVKPWDRNTIPAIERAINNSQLGLNPNNDGVVVRIPIPSLTEERRRDLVKKTQSLVEEAKIAIRQARRDANDILKKAEKDKGISEDQLKRALDAVQSLTDDYVKKADAAFNTKSAEIMEV